MPDDTQDPTAEEVLETKTEDSAEAETDAPLETTPSESAVSIVVNGKPLAVPAGMSLAAALLLHGLRVLRRSANEQTPRGLFCGMGVCFECLVTVDGRAGQQACRLRVRDGMQIALPEVLAGPVTEPVTDPVGHD